MPIASRVWTWLGKPRNRGALGFLGAGLAAVVAAAWQLYLHLTPPVAPPPSVVIQGPAAQAQGLPAANPPVDASAAKTVMESETRAANAEADALNNLAQKIEDSNPPHQPPAPSR